MTVPPQADNRNIPGKMRNTMSNIATSILAFTYFSKTVNGTAHLETSAPTFLKTILPNVRNPEQ